MTWWESTKRMQGASHRGHYPPWEVIKALMTSFWLKRVLMRAKYVLERYRQGFLAKLYNLRQEDKSVETYYGEF